MAEANPYMAPTADIDNDGGEFGEAKIFSPKSRAGRLRFLARNVITTICIYLVAGIGAAVIIASDPAAMAENPENVMATGGFMLAYFAVVILAAGLGIVFAIQRLHDLDKSGWLAVLGIIPLVNALFGLYLLFAPGTDGENRFGPPPPPNTLGVKLAALVLPLVAIVGILAAIAIPAYQDYAVRAQAQMQAQ